MGLVVKTAIHPEPDDHYMPYNWFVGIDWGSAQHQVCVLDSDRRRVGERVVDHDGASLARLADWLWTVSAGHPQRVAVAIEVPRGAIVEGLLDRGFHVFAINPKQLDRFRDRHSVAGAKDEGPSDVAIVLSLPGVGRKSTAWLFAEAAQPLAERDDQVLRTQGGVAPVTKQRGKRRVVVMRRSCNPRLRQVLYHMGRVAMQRDVHFSLVYVALRAKGQRH
jgi:transposase